MNCAGNIDMYFSPYKGRSVELGDIVDVYRNLTIENDYNGNNMMKSMPAPEGKKW
ncbi:hypothetical protein [Peribacillus asahii]|uniref:hypothetical protein n=1 Tax=Peribacillus asahii TaxID=228899 RepID=UPI00207ADF9F|nr:hypothetical protein [Peribacillus asahii]USK62375.1 hypothetical protein LIT37_23045 [Peribacillus asahii]